MVKAIVDIREKTNRVLNIVKAEYGLKDKSQAIDKVVEKFEEFSMDEDVKPEYIKKLRKIQKQKALPAGNIKDFRRTYGLG
ncbi:MAG: DUF2683 family protein [Candidatus Aenigmarchaeota archaeon]|nr:DUF2683 family protein [Candidatus Aenigmarchaeota archaeon]